jgi:hypothetical protein
VKASCVYCLHKLYLELKKRNKTEATHLFYTSKLLINIIQTLVPVRFIPRIMFGRTVGRDSKKQDDSLGKGSLVDLTCGSVM